MVEGTFKARADEFRKQGDATVKGSFFGNMVTNLEKRQDNAKEYY